MDVSDGLLSDLPKIAQASGVGINLTFGESELSSLTPLSEKVGISPLELFLRSGEEHSFIVVVGAEHHSALPKQWIMLGEVVAGSELTHHGKELSLQSKSWHW